ncbi:MAG: hypothetical protein J5758_00530 [Abditibacteriota bacterium]|nr:hypothetical protein [Abditibacteriota bacterium]
MSNVKFTISVLVLTALLLSLAAAVFAAGELKSYVRSDDKAFDYSLSKIQLYNNRQVSVSTFDMTSQEWQGEKWTHKVQIYYPAQCTMKSIALLLVTGGNPSTDKTMTLVQACSALAAPVAIIYNIPNQPLFEKTEDALIAYTFEKAVEEGDMSSWPLLFPMVKSVVKAMDLIEEFTKDNFDTAISQFVVAGASKRGWTSWLSAGIGDARVCGIVPLVFDFLKMPEQLAHEQESYTELSDQLNDYKDINILDVIKTPQGAALIEAVDPFTNNEAMTCPKLLINGTNDQYWTLDSASLYFDDLKGVNNYLYYNVNGNHSTGDLSVQNMSGYIGTLKAFMNQCGGESAMNRMTWKWSEEGDDIVCRIKTDPAYVQAVKTYDAEASRRDFRNVRWVAGQNVTRENDGFVFTVKKPKGSFKGAFVEVDFMSPNGAYTLFTAPYVFDGTK